MRSIDADALKELITEDIQNGGSDIDFDRGFECGLKEAIEFIDNAPTVEFPEQVTIKCNTEEDRQKLLSAFRNARVTGFVEFERPQGEWIHSYITDIFCECSNCHMQMPIKDYFNFCPNCGADMGSNKND